MNERRPVRVVIVDDEPAAREVILTFLSDEPGVEVVGQATNGDEAVELIRALEPDLVFLDIQMPDRDGFRVLEALGDDTPPGIVFVTAHDEHALRAFEVRALDYLLKPFGRPRFRAAMGRALQRLEAEDALDLKRTFESMLEGRRAGSAEAGSFVGAGSELNAADQPRPTRLGVRIGARTVLVEVEDIDWIEAEGDYVRLHTGTSSHLVSDRMHRVQAQLDPARFLRIHRSVIVQLPRIRELRRESDGGGAVILHSGVRLRAARGRWEELERALGLM